jgi:O-antigen/teichoic acid export membrane protein
MSLKRVFFKDTFLYGITSYLGLLAGIILTPIYTRFLSKEEFGIMDLYNTWNNFFIIIIPLGLSTAILRTFHDYNNNKNELKENLGTLLITLIINNLIYFGISLLLTDIIKDYYFQTNLDFTIYFLSFGIVTMTVITSYFQSLNRIRFKLGHYIIINLVPFLIMVFGGYYLVIVQKTGIAGFFQASFISCAIGLILSLIFGKEFIYFKFNRRILVDTLKYSLPLLFVLIFIRFTHLIDRIIINSMLDISAVGDFSIAMRINNIFQIFISAFTTAWFPYAMSIIRDENRNEIYRKAFNYYLLGFGFLCFIVVLFSKELLLIFAPSYLNVETVIYPLLISTWIGGLSYFFGLGIQVAKKTIFLVYSSFISFIVNVGLSYLLTLQFGLIGVILGTLTATLVWIFVEYYFSKKVYDLSFPVKNLFLILLGVIVITFAVYFINLFALNFWLFLVLKVLFSGLIAIYILYKMDLINLIKEKLTS